MCFCLLFPLFSLPLPHRHHNDNASGADAAFSGHHPWFLEDPYEAVHPIWTPIPRETRLRWLAKMGHCKVINIGFENFTTVRTYRMHTREPRVFTRLSTSAFLSRPSKGACCFRWVCIGEVIATKSMFSCGLLEEFRLYEKSPHPSAAAILRGPCS